MNLNDPLATLAACFLAGLLVGLAVYFAIRARQALDAVPDEPEPEVEYWEIGRRVFKAIARSCPCGQCGRQMYEITLERGGPAETNEEMDELADALAAKVRERVAGGENGGES